VKSFELLAIFFAPILLPLQARGGAMLANLTIGLTIWTLTSVVAGLIIPWFITFHECEGQPVGSRSDRAA
jgi:hypothetical protein